MHENPTLGIIGGSGFYEMPGLEDTEIRELTTPFGVPSSPILLGTLEDTQIAFLNRHGDGHQLTPSEVNYQANIYALKLLGVDRVLSISACGSLRDDYEPGDIVIPKQLFDFTRDRKRTFFGGGFVAHVNVADPFCADFSDLVVEALRQTNTTVHIGGSSITIEGPRFSTRVESNIYRSWGISIIGMTTSPEAFLAREAELCYSVMAHVTDFDVWHVTEEPVTVERVIEILNRNTKVAQEAVRNIARMITPERKCNCKNALADALITREDVIPSETRKKLDLLVHKYL